MHCLRYPGSFLRGFEYAQCLVTALRCRGWPSDRAPMSADGDPLLVQKKINNFECLNMDL